MMSQPGYQKIVIHILFNNLRNKDNQTKKFGQLIESNLRNIIYLKMIHKIWWRK